MTHIELKLDNESDFTQLGIQINGETVEYSCQDNSIVVLCDLEMGLHQLTLTMLNGSRVSVSDVKIDSASVRQTLYMSYIKTATGQTLQPATVVWDKSQQWVLPFGNPVSYWITLVLNKVGSQELGKDLSEIYNIIYPEKIKLSSQYPRVVQDFFNHNFDFFCKPKADTNLLPYRKCNLDIANFNVQDAVKEIENNWQWIYDRQTQYAQKYYNDLELPSNYPDWFSLMLYNENKWALESFELPALQALVKSLPVQGMIKSYIGLLPPGGIIAPHVDSKPNHTPGKIGCSTLYIPLKWPAGNYFKFASGGLIDSNTPWFINITDHVHALVNDSDSSRIILSITLDPKQNSHLLA